MNVHLISAILKSIWAIDPDAALSYSPLLHNLVGEGPKVEFDFTGREFAPVVMSPQGTRINPKWGIEESYPEGSVAVIPLKGPLMKEDQYCGPAGMATIGSILKAADRHRDISAIVLHIDSPGGTVDGTADLADIVAGLEKPVVAFADGLMASAALWIGSAADEVMASGGKAEIGSVGVMLSFADVQPAYEKLGVKFHSIVSSLSEEKNRLFNDVREGKYDEYRKEVLDPLARDFIAAMKRNRPGAKEGELTGKLFFAEEVQGTLVDSIGTLEDAVRKAASLAENKKITQSKTTHAMKKFTKINQVLGVEQLESQDDGVFLNQDQLEALETALDQQAVDASALQEATAGLASAREEVTDANARIEELEAEVATLRTGAGAEPARIVASQDPVKTDKDANVTSGKKSFLENLEAVERELL